jgi:hypothetical protein
MGKTHLGRFWCPRPSFPRAAQPGERALRADWRARAVSHSLCRGRLPRGPKLSGSSLPLRPCATDRRNELPTIRSSFRGMIPCADYKTPGRALLLFTLARNSTSAPRAGGGEYREILGTREKPPQPPLTAAAPSLRALELHGRCPDRAALVGHLGGERIPVGWLLIAHRRTATTVIRIFRWLSSYSIFLRW